MLSRGRAFIITKEERAGGKLRRSAGGQHKASFDLRGKDSRLINTPLFFFLGRGVGFWFFFNVREIGNSKDYIQHGLVSVKDIFQDLHAPPNVPVHFTGLEYITSVVVSVAGKIPWTQDSV